MFFRILKKDLKRKKTMNIILLLFVILCSMFAAASVNNIIAVTGGIEHYFNAANVPDAFVQIIGDNDAEEKVRALPSVNEVKAEHWLIVQSSKSFKHKGVKLDTFVNPAGIISDNEMGINYFDESNSIIDHVEKGTFYATSVFLQKTDIKVGDEVELELGDTKLKLKFAGRFKGALFSSETTSNPFLIFNSEDYKLLDKEEATHQLNYSGLYVKTDDIDALIELAGSYESVSVSSRERNKEIYLYDMMAAYIMMSISIVLMIAAFVVLRFTINFTISEEFREIGVMKAVGVDNFSIRSLYIAKYLAISVIGAAIGFFGSLPLSDLMLEQVSKNMVLGSESSKLMGVFSSAAVVVIILLFCYSCTRRVNKLSPVDAVRNGQTGERFGKRSVLHLGRSKLPATPFMALNDVLSAPKQFVTITVIFTLCILIITLMSNFALTLKSEKILWLFDVPASEAHILDSNVMTGIIADYSSYKTVLEEKEKMLADNGMPAACTMTLSVTAEAAHGDTRSKLMFNVTKGNTEDTLRVDEGYAPRKLDEVAMTVSALNDLNAKIGDRIKVTMGDEEYEFIITGRYSSFSSHAVFMYKDFDFDKVPVTGYMGIQIHFEGNPDKETIDKNVETIKKLVDSEKVYNTSDFINNFTGMSDTLNAIKQLMMVLTAIVTALIVVLMERSFISKEKSELALMKAVGISNGSIIAQHTLRFLITAVFAGLLASAVLMPLSDFMMNKICLLIGDVSGIKCAADPIEVFVISPLLLIAVAFVGAFLTALYTKTVKAGDTASIE